jgi:hypothetical protein
VDRLRLGVGDELRTGAEVDANAPPGEIRQGAALGDAGRVVQGYRLPHQIHSALVCSVMGKEPRGQVSAFDLESLCPGHGRRTEIVQDAGEEQQV